jgi:hypothetical protein
MNEAGEKPPAFSLQNCISIKMHYQRQNQIDNLATYDCNSLGFQALFQATATRRPILPAGSTGRRNTF